MIANCRSKWLAGVWEPTIPHRGLLNIKTGFKGVCRVVELSTPLVLQWFAGLFGNAEIGLVLTKKNDKKLCWNHITCLCFYELLGRTLQRRAPRGCWRTVWRFFSPTRTELCRSKDRRCRCFNWLLHRTSATMATTTRSDWSWRTMSGRVSEELQLSFVRMPEVCKHFCVAFPSF